MHGDIITNNKFVSKYNRYYYFLYLKTHKAAEVHARAYAGTDTNATVTTLPDVTRVNGCSSVAEMSRS